MKLSVNMIVQIIGTLLQIVNASGGLLPAKYQVAIAGALGGVQTIIAAISHFSNPDGTPSAVSYQSPQKEIK